MFLRLAAQLNPARPAVPGAGDINALFDLHTNDLIAYLEDAWAARAHPKGPGALGVPGGNQPDLRDLARPGELGLPAAAAAPDPRVAAPQRRNRTAYGDDPWRHLIYAFVLENTGVVEIFRRVLLEIVSGETLGPLTNRVHHWARVTEDLFFSDRLGTWLFPPTSQLRGDGNAVRRNAYYRMFGADLIHGGEDGKPYPYVRPPAANRQFIPMFEMLLREVWRGHVNRRNRFASNTTDDVAISDLAQQLRDMMQNRRNGGALAREEFYSVAMLSWFHATLTGRNEVIEVLRAQASNVPDQLHKVGERVGLPCHSRTYHFFEMAGRMSELLTRIERGFYMGANVSQLYAANSAAIDVIHHWAMVSGKNLKELVGAPAPPTMGEARFSLLESGMR